MTVDRLKWGNEFFKKTIHKSADSDISPGTLSRIKRFGFTIDYCFNF